MSEKRSHLGVREEVSPGCQRRGLTWVSEKRPHLGVREEEDTVDVRLRRLAQDVLQVLVPLSG